MLNNSIDCVCVSLYYTGFFIIGNQLKVLKAKTAFAKDFNLSQILDIFLQI